MKMTIIACSAGFIFLLVCNSFHSLATRYVRQTETANSEVGFYRFEKFKFINISLTD
jgi:hypothetical protein